MSSIIFNNNKKTEGLILNVNTIAINDSSAMMDITPTKIGTEDDYTAEEVEEKEEEVEEKEDEEEGVMDLSLIHI